VNAYILDGIPIPILFGLICLGSLAAYWGGNRLGAWRDRRVDTSMEYSSRALVGALLGLLAFLLAVTMGMAGDRFATRQRLVIDEATLIEQLYLRAGLLQSSTDRDALRGTLEEYVPLRISTSDRAVLDANWERSGQLLLDLWSSAQRSAASDPAVEPILDAISQESGLHRLRLQSNLEDRVPPEVLLVLLAGVVASLVVVGQSEPRDKRPDLVTAVALAIGLAAVLTLVVDLDRPRDGLLQVSQQPLLDLPAEFREITGQPAP